MTTIERAVFGSSVAIVFSHETVLFAARDLSNLIARVIFGASFENSFETAKEHPGEIDHATRYTDAARRAGREQCAHRGRVVGDPCRCVARWSGPMGRRPGCAGCRMAYPARASPCVIPTLARDRRCPAGLWRLVAGKRSAEVRQPDAPGLAALRAPGRCILRPEYLA